MNKYYTVIVSNKKVIGSFYVLKFAILEQMETCPGMYRVRIRMFSSNYKDSVRVINGLAYKKS